MNVNEFITAVQELRWVLAGLGLLMAVAVLLAATAQDLDEADPLDSTDLPDGDSLLP